MRRFFVSPQGIEGEKVYITGSEAHHLVEVLRLKEGDQVIIIDGTGLEYEVRINTITEGIVKGDIKGVTSSTRDTSVKVTLVQGIPKGDKMELIIQKCTELGVTKIIPILTERTVVKLDNDKKKKRQERWQKIAQEASKQCKRATVPEVTEIIKWEQYLNSIDDGEEIIVLWEDELTRGLKSYLQVKKKLGSLSLVIGPEGGFSPSEITQLRNKGAKTVSLGPRILRAETAGLAALTMVLYELGDLG
ncbi:MAG: rRNA (uracil1498-N3)-methyltransferase [Clostridia bacterium]|jgi:16S rRNA (uracil1498-N3)-methyltransferase|nr:rRNA (uracil1498-N3)-methyltransferase [Clostridia bacterium]MDN5321761.1 rRNA (uracil1498-N3)-methyltransferase [Clostridia bacterium]